MKKLLQASLLAAGFAVVLVGCSENSGDPQTNQEGPNLKGEPAGPRPTPALGGGGSGGPGANVKVQEAQ